MFENLENLNINLDNQNSSLIENFEKYFLEYNENVNLISKNDAAFLFEKHIYDSLSFNLFKTKYNIKNDIKLMDIGTGGGFPAIPLSLYYKDMKITAVDSINKKINFINSVSEKFNLKNLHPLCSRIEDLPLKYRNNFDVITTRAMAELRIILEYAVPFIKKNGYFVAFKSLKAEEELFNAKNAIKLLNIQLIDKIEYSLPIENETRRVLLVFKKIGETPSLYPRKNGIIKKNPL